MFGIFNQRRVSQSYRAVFNADSPQACDVLLDLARQAGYGETTATYDRDGRLDPIATALMEGRRQLFLYIKGRCTWDDEDLEAMQATLGGEEFE